MLKIAGGIVLGFFGIIFLCIVLADFSKENKVHNFTKPENVILANECRKLIIEKIKNPENIKFHIELISSLSTNEYMTGLTFHYEGKTAILGSVVCIVKQIDENSFKTSIHSESYYENI